MNSFSNIKFAPALASGAVAYLGTKAILPELEGTTVALPIAGLVGTATGIGVVTAVSSILSEPVGRMLLPSLPSAISLDPRIAYPLLTGIGNAAIMSSIAPGIENVAGWTRMGAVGGGSYFIGQYLADMAGMRF